LGGTARGNVPCPYTFTVNIIGGRLNLHNIVRSNDVILGLPHDVAGFALLQAMLAQRLGVELGLYTHSISNAHVYDIHYEAAEDMIKRPSNQPGAKLELPKDSFVRAENKDESLVFEIFENLSSQYQPDEPIKGLRIVL
jgi:thymidylate synthase